MPQKDLTGKPAPSKQELLLTTKNIMRNKEYIMEDAVLKAMQDAGKPVRPGDIAKALNVDSKEVSKAIDALKKTGKVHSPKRCYYEPVA